MPQNIDMQDRVVGPLTMIQFIYAVFGAGIAYIIVNTLPSPLSWGLAVLIVTFVVATIFVKINERSFLQFLGSLLMFTTKPRVRLWSKSNQPISVDIYEAPDPKKNRIIQQKNISKEQLSNLASTLDSHSKLGKEVRNIKT